MFELQKTYTFEAGHSLEKHDGKCKGPHGHSYILTIHIVSERLIPDGPKTNMVIDFSDISNVVKPMILQFLDHKWLNTTLNTDSATAEFIACWIYHHLEPSLPGLSAITLWETSSSCVTYRKK